MASEFDLTWDYLCPFARNAHEHVVQALQAGAPWQVRFRFFSLSQAHAGDGPVVWDDPTAHSGVLAGLAGVVVRDQHPDQFLAAHAALFAARHDKGLDLRDEAIVAQVLDEVGLDGAGVVKEAQSGWPAERARAEHEEAVNQWEVFGVPTFITGGKAFFVRLMRRPAGDAELARSTVDRVLQLAEGFPELNEYKFTQVPQ